MKKLGIDLGGTSVKLGVVETGKVLCTAACNTPVAEGYEAVVAQIAEVARALLAQYPDVREAGIGSPGLIDNEKGLVCTSNNFGWENKPLRYDLAAALGLPVRIANDAHCATLAEALYGAGRGYGRVAMLTIGTGLGGGFVKDGHLESERYGSIAYIFGHAVVQHDGRQCSCGRRGCLEAYVSAGAMTAKSDQLYPGGKSVKELFADARAGEVVAKGVLREFLAHLCDGAVNLANMLRPHVIVIGGGVSPDGDMITEALNAALEKDVYGYAYAPVRAVTATLGNTAGLVGAATLS